MSAKPVRANDVSAPYGHIKGSAIRELVLWYERKHDPTLLRAVARAMPPELDARLEPDAPGLGILASRWYDARVVHLLLDATVAKHPPDARDALLREGIREVVRGAARGMYAFVIGQIVSPELYARNIQRLWGLLQDTGERRIEITGPQALSITRGWRGHHPIACRVNQHTMAVILEVLGKRDVRFAKERCVADGSPDCCYRFVWTG
ncbi:MAG: hypothetical protein K1X94_17845 [Sandaracinaceae bacterium]|nr:hypothetical protein [Sandaracinaceae bacterium]